MSKLPCGVGMISPTSGEAVINGMSIRDQMGRIRQNLGVCPQFDILWPDITVQEHLELYAAIKGYSAAETKDVVVAAAANVGASPAKSSFEAQHSTWQAATEVTSAWVSRVHKCAAFASR